jgi:hypothetical protein
MTGELLLKKNETVSRYTVLTFSPYAGVPGVLINIAGHPPELPELARQHYVIDAPRCGHQSYGRWPWKLRLSSFIIPEFQ